MPYRAANGVSVTTSWTQPFLWPYVQGGAERLDVFVNGTDVVAQFLEEPNSQAFENDQTQEVLFRRGFQSFPAETPFYAVRFKVWDGTLLAQSGTVDMRMVS